MKITMFILLLVLISCNGGNKSKSTQPPAHPTDESASSVEVPLNDDYPDEDSAISEQQRTDRITHMQDHLESHCHEIWGNERPMAQFDVEPDGTLVGYQIHEANDSLKACLMQAIEAAKFNFGALSNEEETRYVIPLTPH